MKVAAQNFSVKGLGLIILFYTSMYNMVKNTLNRTLKLSSTEMRTHMVDWPWADNHSSTQFWNCNAYNECMQVGRRNGQGLITQAEWKACNAARSYGRQPSSDTTDRYNSRFYLIPLLMHSFIHYM